MMNFEHSWHGPGAIDHVKGLAWQGLLRATVYFWQECQRALNIPNPPPYTTPSRPGEPPRKRTGFGQGAVIYETDQSILTTRVGVLGNAKYMAILELFRSRPWLKLTLDRTIATLRALVKPRS